jgi:hypothetical protein
MKNSCKFDKTGLRIFMKRPKIYRMIPWQLAIRFFKMATKMANHQPKCENHVHL